MCVFRLIFIGRRGVDCDRRCAPRRALCWPLLPPLPWRRLPPRPPPTQTPGQPAHWQCLPQWPQVAPPSSSQGGLQILPRRRPPAAPGQLLQVDCHGHAPRRRHRPPPVGQRLPPLSIDLQLSPPSPPRRLYVLVCPAAAALSCASTCGGGLRCIFNASSCCCRSN